MIFHALRFVFLLLLAGVAAQFMASSLIPPWLSREWIMPLFMLFGVAVVAADISIPRKSLTALSGAFFGLVVGMVAAYGLSLVVDLLIVESAMRPEALVRAIKLGLGIVCCYFAISLILQTKDDIRFIIPYVEFTKQKKGGRPVIMDTSVIIDGRIADIADTRIIEGDFVLPRFILNELQAVADSADKLKRNRGRRGLDMLSKLQSSRNVEIKIVDVEFSAEAQAEDVDQKLVTFAQQVDGRIMTNDYNLNKVAQLRGIEVININDLANALKPVFLPGERIVVKMIKPGEEADQGIGYLEDGTMIVASGGRRHINEDVEITVTSVLQTSAGRMIFGKTDDAIDPRRRDR
ncbi:MAG: PIN/TRAM domain-containing protein [Planctomycetes bacterium]|nr:PIN/TRAM domain-containing protein [Planctomycetota bacterium]MCH8963728.1 PIN/TRAM domain-containing protein [Planctomycetota bacterium]